MNDWKFLKIFQNSSILPHLGPISHLVTPRQTNGETTAATATSGYLIHVRLVGSDDVLVSDSVIDTNCYLLYSE